MLRNKDLALEISSLEKVMKDNQDKDPIGAALLKALVLQLKLLRNIRSNQTTQMKAQGINLIQPTTRGKENNEEEENS